MKKLILGLLVLCSTTSFAGTYEAKMELLQARALIDSALRKLDADEFVLASRVVKNAAFVCRETATTNEVLEAIVSSKKEVNARCDGRCEVIMLFEQVNSYDCKITAKGIR